MSTNNAKIQSVIESTFDKAINKLTSNESNCYSDLFVQVDSDSGELQIYDEEEKLIEKTVIFDWVNNAIEDEKYDEMVIAPLKSALSVLSAKKAFESACFMKPFSISLTDEDFSVIEELLFLDDETLRLDDPLLKNLDADLDEFLSELLSDVK
jgi:hypothetical protein